MSGDRIGSGDPDGVMDGRTDITVVPSEIADGGDFGYTRPVEAAPPIEPGDDLPATGSNATQLFVLIGLVLMAIGAALVASVQGRNRRQLRIHW